MQVSKTVSYSKQNGGGQRKKRVTRKRTGKLRRSLGSIGPMQIAPAAMASRPQATRAPRVNNMPAGTMEVAHTEFLMTVLGSTDFSVVPFPLNPARDVTFNWLADTATRFSKYKFKNLRFNYKNSCSSQTAGEILMIVNPDASQAPPVTQQAAYSYQNAMRCVPWQECTTTVLPQVLNKELFTLSGAQPPGTDIKTYNAGNLFFCTSGFGATGVACGVLTVSYDVLLINPVVQNTVQSSEFISVGGVDATHLFGTATVPSGLLDISIVGGGSQVQFNQEWHGIVSAQFDGTTAFYPLGTVGSTCTIGPLYGTSEATACTFIQNIIAERGDILELQAANLVTGAHFFFTPLVNG